MEEALGSSFVDQPGRSSWPPNRPDVAATAAKGNNLEKRRPITLNGDGSLTQMKP